MSESAPAYNIILEPAGPLGNPFFTLDEALAAARELEAVGHKIQAITNGTQTLQGEELRTALASDVRDFLL